MLMNSNNDLHDSAISETLQTLHVEMQKEAYQHV